MGRTGRTPLEASNSAYLGWPGKPRLGTREFLVLGTFAFANSFLWTGLLLLVLPLRVAQLVGPGTATSELSLLSMAGGAVAALTQPLFGALSDRLAFPSGRRRPQMALGTAGLIVSLVLMGSTREMAAFFVSFLFVQFFANLAGSAYLGLLPDLVPPEQRGMASGFAAFAVNMGVLMGSLAAYLLGGARFETAGAVVFGTSFVVIWLFVQEPRPSAPPAFQLKGFLGQFWLDKVLYRDFIWVFITRFLVMAGIYVLETYLFYELRFVLKVQDPSRAVVVVLMAMTLSALLASLAGGALSDRLKRRKILVAVSGLLMGASALFFVFLGSLPGAIAAALLFGLGYGGYQSTDLALAVDTLPAGTAAKDMGLWGLSATLPQILSASLGLFLASLVIPHFGVEAGYRSLFGVTFVLFVAGSALIFRVRKVA